jgi:CRISPR-associated protein (TIGR03986 family)
MSNVKSTYNFVPAPTEDQVYKPGWANQVSHDVPFSDGESGEIELKITAETPVFTRDGHSKAQVTNEFSHYYDGDGKKIYFIPATSLKGMFRNVLEIMSFSRLNSNLVNADRYSFRDLSSAKTQYMDNYKKFKIKAGWLVEKLDGSWIIEECQDLAFINHKELKEQRNFKFRDFFLHKNPEEKTAEYKYKIAGQNPLEGKFSTETVTLFGGVQKNIAKYDDSGKKGTLVFTGQSSKRTEPEPPRKSSGKINEFVFFDAESPNHLIIDAVMQKDFKFIYYNDDKNNISKDWKYWRNNFLEKGKKVPVFYSKDDTGKLNHFGLSYMYKLPYKNSVSELLPLKGYKKEELDLATIMFGFTDNIKESLKGRVMIGNAQQSNAVFVLSEVKEIMGGPKASYFPFYLEQYKNSSNSSYNTYNTYNTYDDGNAALRGFKRYPIHANGVKTGYYDEKQQRNEKVFSTFSPIDSGGEFVCKVRFHNLKPQEIGALLSAITFHGNDDKCFHSLGGAKAFGYGKVKVSINQTRFLEKSNEEYMTLFEQDVETQVPNWWKSTAMKELFAMASNSNDFTLEYPSIQEFVDYKKTKVNNQPKEIEKLDSYSEILGSKFNQRQFKSVAQKTEIQEVLQLDEFVTFDKISLELRTNLEEKYADFSEENKDVIALSLKRIYSLKHRDSIKKMNKENTWVLNLIPMLGEEKANTLINDLKIEF